MQLSDLRPAIAAIRDNPVPDLRARTYLLTYPHILREARNFRKTNSAFALLALIAYGWMPRVVRLEPKYIFEARKALNGARKRRTSSHTENADIVEPVAACIRSVVGASKLLHFVNPHRFPIWDSRVEGFRRGKAVPGRSMNATNYLLYMKDVAAILVEPTFLSFYKSLNLALAGRLKRLGIKPYPVSRVRAVECAAFELAGGTPGDP